MSELRAELSLDELTVTGHSLGHNLQGAEVLDPEVIRPISNPVSANAMAVLRGNLAPEGAVMKPSAMSEQFRQHQALSLRTLAQIQT